MRLTDRTCLVTGAAKRVGRGIALELARRGARVAVHCGASLDAARATALECRELSGGRETIVVQTDQRDPDAIERAVAEVESALGPIDVLVNNASVFYPTKFLNLTREQWDEMLEVNLRGPAWFCRCVAPGMVERGEGVIVNIADTTSDAPLPHFAPYGAAKAGLVSLTRALARELAPAVRVNAISPGAIVLPPGSSERLKQQAEASSALKRLGTPEDIASACAFLIEGSDFVTGAVLPVDGGYLGM